MNWIFSALNWNFTLSWSLVDWWRNDSDFWYLACGSGGMSCSTWDLEIKDKPKINQNESFWGQPLFQIKIYSKKCVKKAFEIDSEILEFRSLYFIVHFLGRSSSLKFEKSENYLHHRTFRLCLPGLAQPGRAPPAKSSESSFCSVRRQSALFEG